MPHNRLCHPPNSWSGSWLSRQTLGSNEGSSEGSKNPVSPNESSYRTSTSTSRPAWTNHRSWRLRSWTLSGGNRDL